MLVIAGSSNNILAENIANNLQAQFIQANTERFEDQELRIQIEGQLYEQDVIIVQSTSKPANDHLMELLLLADTAKRAGARRILAVIPYFGYSRQDRPSYIHGPISASLVAKLLEATGIDRIITLDLHSKQIEGFFRIGVQNLNPLVLFQPLFKDKSHQVVISPDIGGVFRAKQFSNMLNCDLAIINKIRPTHSQCLMNEIIGDIKDKHCIIVDDIVDTAGTICKASALLINEGALSVTACITHPVLSSNSLELIQKSAITKLYVTNSILHTKLPEKLIVLPIDTLLANALGSGRVVIPFPELK